MAMYKFPSLVSVGSILFKRRSYTLAPIVLCSLAYLEKPFATGFLAVGIGILIRLLAVSEIGSISRTRSKMVGPLCQNGLYSISRNPIYIGNQLLWLGYLLLCGNAVVLIISMLLIAIQYHLIILWEESVLVDLHGADYLAYMGTTSRYLGISSYRQMSNFELIKVIRSERGTFISMIALLASMGLVRCT